MFHRLLCFALVLVSLGCVAGRRGSATEPSAGSGGVIPCDEVEVLARTDRPDQVRRELSYLQADYVGAPGEPTSHVQVRLRPGGDAAALARRLDANVRSVQGWHLFVFESVAAAKRGVRELLCDSRVVEAFLSLEHRTLR